MSLRSRGAKERVATDPGDFEAVAAGAGVVEYLETGGGELLLAVGDSTAESSPACRRPKRNLQSRARRL